MPVKDLYTLTHFEAIEDIPFAKNAVRVLPTKTGALPCGTGERFIHSLQLEFEGRLAIGVHAATSEHVDSPYSILDAVRVEGTHKIRKQRETVFDLPGSVIRELALQYGGRAPVTTGAIGLTVANHDIRFVLPITFPPENLPLYMQAPHLLDAPHYENLMLEIKFADFKNTHDPDATSTETWTAFGSAAGDPRVRVAARFAQFGPDGAPDFVPAPVWRFYEENTGSDITGGKVGARVKEIDTGNLIRSLLIKSGVKYTTPTAGNSVFATLSDSILAELEVMYSLKKGLGHYNSFYSLQEGQAHFDRIAPSPGYARIDWVQQEDLRTAWDTSGLVGAPNVYLKADVTGAANQAVGVAVQEIRGVPVGI
jgi:hypothetical protein